MTERGREDREAGEAGLTCVACGASNLAGDRFCAECGAPLPASTVPRSSDIDPPAAPAVTPETRSTLDAATTSHDEREHAAWLFAARPVTVMGGGVLLVALAALLLALGQRDDTGTIVMLSFCVAPLGLLTIAIGLARHIASAARRG